MTGQVDIVLEGANGTTSWTPEIGDQTTKMLTRSGLPAPARDRVVDGAMRVLGRCLPPESGEASRAGLVVGNVQSGKTASFTTVTALAHDNGIPLVVLLLGVTNNLLSQGRRRLGADLGINEGGASRHWLHLESPTTMDEARRISQALRPWVIPGEVGPKPTLVVTLMKHHQHLEEAARVLRAVDVPLRDVTALIIDDEADQASLDASRPGDAQASTTYRMIRQLRSALPRHTFLQYTATPQANLLVDLADEVSPDFVTMLEPGDGYVGGEDFFRERRGELVREIPVEDVAAANDPAQETPPSSLVRALAEFLVGAADGERRWYEDGSGPETRSMLVHPSRLVGDQSRFANWIRQTQNNWRDLASEYDSVFELRELEQAYAELSHTVPELCDRGELEPWLRRNLDARVREMNTNSDDEDPQFNQGGSWILVGGQMLDRGYTVEGLTVTYMPRGIGVGNADNIQQRARFYGYKAGYLGYCRLWLASETAEALSEYVRHEGALRQQLYEVEEQGKPLKAWRRQFLLEDNLRPTRQAVIRHRLATFKPGRWYQQRTLAPDINTDAMESWIERNHSVIDELLDRAEEVELPYTGGRPHRGFVANREQVLEALSDYAAYEHDREWLFALEVQMSEAVDKDVLLVLMQDRASRERRLDTDTRIQNLHQGRSNAYRGDAEVLDGDLLTVQIHVVNVTDADSRETLTRAVPALAARAPSRWATVVQGQ